jgi:hypothetical protein
MGKAAGIISQMRVRLLQVNRHWVMRRTLHTGCSLLGTCLKSGFG